MVKGQLQAILKLARNRFGEPDAKTLAASTRLWIASTVERILDRMAHVKPTVKSWKALLAIE